MNFHDRMPEFDFTIGKLFHGDWLPGRIERNRRLYDFELVCFTEGHAQVFIEEADRTVSYECVAGTALIIPPGRLHCTVAVGSTERWCIHFAWFDDCFCHREDLWPYVFADSGEPFEPERCAKAPEALAFPFFRTIATAEILPLLRRFFGAADTDDFGTKLIRKGRFLELLGAIFTTTQPRTKPGRQGGIFLTAKEYVEKNACSPDLSVHAVAGHFRVTPNYLSTLFRRNLGVSLHEYIISRRIFHAQELLKSGELTVRETAFACGFEDPNYFGRAFARRVGVSPGQMRTPREIPSVTNGKRQTSTSQTPGFAEKPHTTPE
ncbi:MAG: AraC family transcriptional regulator [Victivallaceae bacterium]|nr:AraC family transcriptional regulator [Victivallaceae bacterium]